MAGTQVTLAEVALAPKEGIGIVVSTNGRNGTSAERVAVFVIDQIMDSLDPPPGNRQQADGGS